MNRKWDFNIGDKFKIKSPYEDLLGDMYNDYFYVIEVNNNWLLSKNNNDIFFSLQKEHYLNPSKYCYIIIR